MKLKLIDNWNKAWRMTSVQLAGLLALLASAAEYWPQYVQWLPEGWAKWGALAIMLARIIKQDGLKK